MTAERGRGRDRVESWREQRRARSEEEAVACLAVGSAFPLLFAAVGLKSSSWVSTRESSWLL